MDVHCTTCGEPWDVYHLRHDAIFETDLDPAESKVWRELPPQLRLSQRYREKFKAAGYEFGASVINLLRCPAWRYADCEPNQCLCYDKRRI
jgi:hypothetical protein